MATRKYKKQRKGNLCKKSLGKKKRSMKKRGKSLKKRGGAGRNIYDIYHEYMGTTNTSREGLDVDQFLNLHKKFINLDHGSCSQGILYSTSRIEDCDKTKVLFYKNVLKDVLKYTKMISDKTNDIKTRFKSILIGYAKKIEKHAKYIEKHANFIEELKYVGIEKENEKFKMVEPLINTTLSMNEKYYEEYDAFLNDIMDKINQNANLTNVINVIVIDRSEIGKIIGDLPEEIPIGSLG